MPDLCTSCSQGLALVEPVVDYLEGLQYDESEARDTPGAVLGCLIAQCLQVVSRAVGEFLTRFFNDDEDDEEGAVRACTVLV